MKTSRIPVLFALVCGLVPATLEALEVSVSPTSVVLTANQQQQFTATLTGANLRLYTWAVNGVQGGTAATGTISTSGLYTAPAAIAATTTVTITVTTVAKPAAAATANVTLNPPAVTAPTITTNPSPAVAVTPSTMSLPVGQSQQFSATVNGSATSSGVTWSINPQTGSISSSGLYTAPTTVPSTQIITVTATYGGVSAHARLTLKGSVTISLTPATANLFPSQTQQFTPTVGGTTNTSLTWALSPNTGTISSSGLYTAPATITSSSTVTVTATSAADTTKSASSTITLNPPVQITTASLPGGTVGTAYSTAIAATGGATPYGWSIGSGQLAPGLLLNTVTGAISGTPTVAGTYNVTMKVTDVAGYAASAAFAIAIATCTSCPGPLTITTSSLPNAMVGAAYSSTLAAMGGTAPYTWSVASGSLPAGITLASSGILSGTPSANGNFSFTAKVSDSSSTSNNTSQAVTLTVGGIDAYGGRTDIQCTGGTQPRFYTQKIGSRWWLCTPAGNAMWAQGVYAVGPQGNFTAKYGSSSAANAATLSRIRAWGFNFLDTYAGETVQPWNQPTNKMPTIWVVRPGAYGMVASQQPTQVGSLDQNIKDIFNGLSPYAGIRKNAVQLIGGHHAPDWGDLTRIQSALDYQLTQTSGIDPAGLAPAILSNNSLDYVLGVAVEDSDQTFGYWTSVENYPFDTQPSGMGSPHGGYLTAIVSPIQQADGPHGSLYNTDQTLYVKKAWHDYLVGKYGTISALNTAWGSTYTTFGSSATQVTGESVATTDGTHWQYSHTIGHSGTLTPNSIQVLKDGTMVGGDCFHPSFNDMCNPGGGNNSAAISGSTIGGTVTYSTGSVAVQFTGVWTAWSSVNCTAGVSCTMWFNDYDQPGISAGDKIVTQSSTCCTFGTPVTVTATGTGAYTFSGPYCSPTPEPDAKYVTFPWSGGTVANQGTCSGDGGMVANVTAPAAGHVITINYQVNGWDAGGTGLMDEDGRSTHYSWIGDDPYFCLLNYPATNCGYGGVNPSHVPSAGFVADAQGFMQTLAHNYFSAMRTTVRAAFTNNGIAPPMYVGPDTWGTWTSTPPPEVMQGASGNIDLALFGGYGSYSLTQPMLNAIAANYGGPILSAVFLHANQDSPYSSNSGLSGDYATQAARGSAYQSIVHSYLSSTTVSGINPYVGFGWWQYGDSGPEQTNWGLVTALDNAYDGHEAVTGTVACSAPFQLYACGGETRNYGDVITSIKAANALWKSQ